MKKTVVKQEFFHQIHSKHGIVVHIWGSIMKDQINPDYYKNYSIEVTDAIESWGLSFVQGNIIKYIVRSGKKTTDPQQDLEKALWYLRKELSKYERLQQKSIVYNNTKTYKKIKTKATTSLSRKNKNLARSNFGIRTQT